MFGRITVKNVFGKFGYLSMMESIYSIVQNIRRDFMAGIHRGIVDIIMKITNDSDK